MNLGRRRPGSDRNSRLAIVGALALLAAPAAGQQERRQLGPHEHGHGGLNIAIDGPLLLIELDVPGADILGFEHAPGTPEQNAAVARAEALLRDPRSLFVVPAAAGCRVQDIHLARESDAGQGHFDYHVEYALACTTPAALTGMDFAYFDAFAGAQRLTVNVAGDRGQGQFEATRASPRIEFGRRN